METQIKTDVFGNEINVGDNVAFVARGYMGKDAHIGKGKIFKITNEGCWIKPDKEYEQLGYKYGVCCFNFETCEWEYKKLYKHDGCKWSHFRFIIKLIN